MPFRLKRVSSLHAREARCVPLRGDVEEEPVGIDALLARPQPELDGQFAQGTSRGPKQPKQQVRATRRLGLVDRALQALLVSPVGELLLQAAPEPDASAGENPVV